MYQPAVYTATSGQSAFDCPFAYLDPANVHVALNGTEVSFAWVTTSRVSLLTPAASGDTVQVYRATPIDSPLVDFAANDGSLTGADLNLQAAQLLFHLQEIASFLLNGGVPPTGGGGGGGGSPTTTHMLALETGLILGREEGGALAPEG